MIRSELGAFVLTLVAGGLAGCVCYGSRVRKAVGLCLGAAALLPPWLASVALVRALLSLFGVLILLRTIDLARIAGPLRTTERLRHVFSLVDSRSLRRTRPAVDGLALAKLGGWLLLAGGALAAAYAVSPARGLAWVARWAAGLVAVYAAVEALWALMHFLYRGAGVDAPPSHRFPAASLTVHELWGKRWSRPLGCWLDVSAFRPLARRGLPQMGLLAAFLGSGLVHGYAILAGAGARMAAVMVAYFVVQGLLVTGEYALRASAWSRGLRRAWTLGVMVLTSPLFIEPALRATGIA